MNVFPFSQIDWQRVQDVTHGILNATLADDDTLRESCFAKLEELFEELQSRYGDHPVIHETRADFIADPLLRVNEYRVAIQLAENNSLPTLSIRISLAEVLLEDLADPEHAAAELAACETEAVHTSDQDDRKAWGNLLRRCNTFRDGGKY